MAVTYPISIGNSEDYSSIIERTFLLSLLPRAIMALCLRQITTLVYSKVQQHPLTQRRVLNHYVNISIHHQRSSLWLIWSIYGREIQHLAQTYEDSKFDAWNEHTLLKFPSIVVSKVASLIINRNRTYYIFDFSKI
jgi:hypothetical protein